MKSSSAERDEFSVVAWRLTGIQHSGCHGSARLSPPSITTIRITWVLITLTCTSSPPSSTQYKSTRHSSLSVRSRTHDVDSTPASNISWVSTLPYLPCDPYLLCLLLVFSSPARSSVSVVSVSLQISPISSARYVCGQKGIHYHKPTHHQNYSQKSTTHLKSPHQTQ